MEVLRNKALMQHLENKKNQIFIRKRDCYVEVDNYLNYGADHNVCCIYGLRRTGKTVMVLQAIYDRIDEIDKTLLVLCENNDTIPMLKEVLENNKDVKYIFIDEATKIQNFVNTCSILSDKYKTSDNRIVLSGTDSLGIKFAQGDELFDRCELVHTTYIPYKEHSRLLGKDVLDYISYGGTLTDGYIFKDAIECELYKNTAIVDNIQHTAEQVDLPRINNLINKDLLKSSVNRIIEDFTHDFVLDVVNRPFVSKNLGSVAQLIGKHSEKENFNGPKDNSKLKSENINSAVMFYLGVKTPTIPIEQPEYDDLVKILVKMDVLEKYSYNSYYFIQPGLKHCQIEQLIEGIKLDEAFNEYTNDEKEWIYKKIKEDIEGIMLEEVVISELSKDKNIVATNKVFKFNNLVSEYDVVIANSTTKKAIGIEVKRSREKDVHQKRHLLNDELKNDLYMEKEYIIANRAVLYNGITEKEADSDGVLYINISDFLRNSSLCIDMLLHNDWDISRLVPMDILVDDKSLVKLLAKYESSDLQAEQNLLELENAEPISLYGQKILEAFFEKHKSQSYIHEYNSMSQQEQKLFDIITKSNDVSTIKEKDLQSYILEDGKVYWFQVERDDAQDVDELNNIFKKTDKENAMLNIYVNCNDGSIDCELATSTTLIDKVDIQISDSLRDALLFKAKEMIDYRKGLGIEI